MNRKGFTLIELLTVFVILGIIAVIAIPTITSSMERSKNKQNQQKYNLLESYAEIYVTDHKNAVYNALNNSSSCCIDFGMLSEYLPDDALVDADNNTISGSILFTKPTNNSPASYKFQKEACNIPRCG